MHYPFFRQIVCAVIILSLLSCNKELSLDTSNGGSGANAADLSGSWKLLSMSSYGNEEGTYSVAGVRIKEVYKYIDSTINNTGLFIFSKDSLKYGISYNLTGKEWNYVYQNDVLYSADSTEYNDPATDVGGVPYKIKGDSITLIDDSGAGMFDVGIPATYKYEVSGNKLTLTGKFDFTVKDTLLTYIETYKVSIGSKIFLQKQ